MTIGIVAEGTSDKIIIEALIGHLVPGEHVFLSLQPLRDIAEKGDPSNGWKGVRQWCFENLAQTGLTLDEFLSTEEGRPIDLLIIHLDAGVAWERDLQEGIEPPFDAPDAATLCAPIGNADAHLRRIAARWLNASEPLSPKLVFAIPAEDMETWVFAALFPDDPLCAAMDFECFHASHQRPGFKLSLPKYNVLTRTSTGIIKSVRVYRNLAPSVIENWHYARAKCAQAEQFHFDLSAFRDTVN